jgi:DNA-directed RNA polymerase specialized sigma24 family protein
MSEPFLVPYASAVLEQRARPALEPEERPEFSEADEELMRSALGMLPALERILLLEHLRGWSHAALGRGCGLSKEGVRRRVHRARARLMWLAQWPGIELPLAVVEAVCARHLSRSLRATVLAYWPRADGRARTQAEVGDRYGISQSAVQLRLTRAMDVLNARAEQDEEAGPVAAALVMLVATGSSFVVRDASGRVGKRALRRAARVFSE